MMTFQEIERGDGTIEVHIGEGSERKLTCPVCGCQQFHERNSLLNTRAATFFKFDWANKEATNYICAQCGYIFWFIEG
jgi:predicted nucleic-acid-binding Zn-ribbon protein